MFLTLTILAIFVEGPFLTEKSISLVPISIEVAALRESDLPRVVSRAAHEDVLFMGNNKHGMRWCRRGAVASEPRCFF